MTRRMLRQSFLRVARNGFFSVLPVATASWNSGDSDRRERTTSATTTSTALSRNGTRHFQSPWRPALSANMPLASAIPSGLPDCGMAANMPRRCQGACSYAMVIAPPHSAPNARPWIIRMMTSRTGAVAPIWAYVGSRPISTVAPPMTIMAPTSTGLRPNRSARYPPTAPPRGRMTKPTASVANASRVPTRGSLSGKKTAPKYSADAVPNATKS